MTRVAGGLAGALFICLGTATADPYLSASRQGEYRVALDDLSAAILDKGYTLVKIQPVDVGLRHKGYAVAGAYKLVFFAEPESERQALRIAPEMAAMLPLRVILYEEEGRVTASAPSLATWDRVFTSPVAREMLERWDRDTQAILKQFRDAAPVRGRPSATP